MTNKIMKRAFEQAVESLKNAPHNHLSVEDFTRAVFEKSELSIDIKQHISRCSFCRDNIIREQRHNPIYQGLIRHRACSRSDEEYWKIMDTVLAIVKAEIEEIKR